MTTKPGCDTCGWEYDPKFPGCVRAYKDIIGLRWNEAWKDCWKYCPECGKKAEVVEKPLTPKQVADEVFDRIGKDFADQGALDE